MPYSHWFPLMDTFDVNILFNSYNYFSYNYDSINTGLEAIIIPKEGPRSSNYK